MSIWILQPDQNGTCCACGVRTDPCGSCQTCAPIVIGPQDIQNVIPTGVFFTLNGGTPYGGILTSVNFSNSNSKLTFNISPPNIYLGPNPYIPYGVNNFPVLDTFTFTYQLNVNTGETITLYAETAPSSLPNICGGQGDVTPQGCPSNLVTSAGCGAPFTSVVGDGFIQMNALNPSGQISFTVNNVVLNPSSPLNFGPYTASTLFSVTTQDHCASFDCNIFTGNTVGNLLGTCNSSAGTDVFPNVNGSSISQAQIITFSNYQLSSFFVQGCTFIGNPTPSCPTPPPFVSQSTTFQIKSANKIYGDANNVIHNESVSSLCMEISMTNNGYVQLLDFKGNPIDLHSRLILASIQQNGLP